MKKTLLAALGMLLLLLGGGLLGLYQVGTDAKAYLAVSRETADSATSAFLMGRPTRR